MERNFLEQIKENSKNPFSIVSALFLCCFLLININKETQEVKPIAILDNTPVSSPVIPKEIPKDTKVVKKSIPTIINQNSRLNYNEMCKMTEDRVIGLAKLLQGEAGNRSVEERKSIGVIFLNRCYNGLDVGSDFFSDINFEYMKITYPNLICKKNLTANCDITRSPEAKFNVFWQRHSLIRIPCKNGRSKCIKYQPNQENITIARDVFKTYKYNQRNGL